MQGLSLSSRAAIIMMLAFVFVFAGLSIIWTLLGEIESGKFSLLMAILFMITTFQILILEKK